MEQQPKRAKVSASGPAGSSSSASSMQFYGSLLGIKTKKEHKIKTSSKKSKSKHKHKDKKRQQSAALPMAAPVVAPPQP
eukprot:752557-Pyramimonas_sp.AAC.1